MVDETGCTAAELCARYIDAGLPVVFWATLDFQPVPGVDRWRLLVGYDEENYWFNDPWHNHGVCPQPKALVEACHQAQGMYAVAIRRK